jgi:phosphomannomutase/phosphoglucomutase
MEIIKNINPYIFRAYDIRGEYPTFIDEDVAYTIGLGYGSYIKELGKTECVIGYDNRLSSIALFNALSKGITETGINVINIGLVTTPMLYFARLHLNIKSSIMITASHNPGNENGFKLSFEDFASGSKIQEFANYLNNLNFKTGNGIITNKDIKALYVETLLKDIKINKCLKLVLDLGNGATGIIAKDVFSKINVDVTYLFDTVDGTFPNHHPDPSIKDNMITLINKVKEINADLGIGIDGDGDRIGIIDNLGNFYHADTLGVLYAKDVLKNSSNKKIVGDIKCTSALKEVTESMGGEYFNYRPGASFMMPYVRDNDMALGIEYSGHMYFNDHFIPITSAIYSALRLLEILSSEDKSLNTLINEIPKYFKSDEIKIPTTDLLKFNIVEKVGEYARNKSLKVTSLDGSKIIYPDGWALIRSSNTGPNLTVIFEFKTEERLEEIKTEYLNLINLFNK